MPPDPAIPRGEEQGGRAAEPSRWCQRGGFSIFFDVGVDDRGAEAWRTRIYHEETGHEAVMGSADAAGWSRWILERLSGERASASTSAGDAYDVVVEIVDVRSTRQSDETSGVDTVKVEAELRIRGLEALERDLGAAVVGHGFGRAGDRRRVVSEAADSPRTPSA